MSKSANERRRRGGENESEKDESKTNEHVVEQRRKSMLEMRVG